MQNRRKLALLAAVLMVLALFAGCGKPQEQSSAPEESSTTEQSSSVVEPEKKEYTAGVRTEKEYTSEWMGLKYTLSDSMVMATDEEILQYMEAGDEMLYTDSGEIDYENLGIVYEMAAVDATTAENLSIMVEKLALSGMSEAQYMEAVKQSLAQVDNAEVTLGEESTCMVAGLEFGELQRNCAVSPYHAGAGGVESPRHQNGGGDDEAPRRHLGCVGKSGRSAFYGAYFFGRRYGGA